MSRHSAKGRRNHVRHARLAADVTQAQLAADVGVTRQTVVAVEAGNYAPSVYLALAVSARLGMTVEELFAPQTDDTQAAAATPPRRETSADESR